MLELTRRLASLILIAVLVAGLCAAQSVSAKDLRSTTPENVGISSTRLKRLSAVLDQYVEDEKLPGGVALVARRGKIVYREPFGQRDREAKSPMKEDTIFRIASQTKALVSVGIMMLQECYRLSTTLRDSCK
ncbi:MAG: serine hydrolase domain-containing protein [Pseudomonadales bacterium]